MRTAGGALRLAAGAWLAWWTAAAVVAPDMPPLAAAAAILVAAATLWRPASGLLAAACLTPAGGLLAAAPVRSAELVASAFLAAWLLRYGTPLAPAGWPRTCAVPALLYLATIVASWAALSIADAAGVAALDLPRLLVWLIPADHLVLSSPEPETWTMLLNVAGFGLLFAAMAIARQEPRLVARLAGVLAVVMAGLSVVTVLDVARQWADADYAGWFLRRYVDGERFSLHLPDPNAAASLYALGGTAAGLLAVLDHGRRWRWIAAVVVMIPGTLLAGSVSAAFGALLAGGAMLIAISRPVPGRRASTSTVAVCAALIVICAIPVALATRRAEGRATATQALSLRAEFLETSARMFGSAPVSGVGVGRYFDRSAEFMPPALRDFYGNENAHNYFLQQFAELGVMGGILFAWLIAVPLASAWTRVRAVHASDRALAGLTGGVTAYVLTCLTGHPLLVPGAAMPFWIALGAIAGATAAPGGGARGAHRISAALVVLLAAGGIVRAAATSRSAETPPREHGFHQPETDEEGAPFRWMTRHAVTYIPAEPGIVRLTLRPPDDPPLRRPLTMEIAVEGRPVARRELPEEEWTTIDIGVRGTSSERFRRLDLRTNQEWTQPVMLAQRRAARPIGAMVRAIEWMPSHPVR